MSVDFDISIVVSSFNRENKIRQTVESIFRSDLTSFKAVELIIIDDGSPNPVENALASATQVPEPICMRLIKQTNLGIGATRNRGFREARSKLVLFLDDDIILERDTVKKIVEGEKEHPGGVIFGNYPFISHNSESLHRFAAKLFNYDGITTKKEFERVDAITSGLLCVNKERLGNPQNFYRDDMTVPAAEEHEVIARFSRMGIQIFHAKHIVATHNHHLELGWLARQQFKYGMATAEAFVKSPEILEMDKFVSMKRSLEPKGWKKIVKSFFVSPPGRGLFFAYARLLERITPAKNHNRVFGLLTTIFFYAGYKQGMKKFLRNG
jgi:glycosyltransferase involved in cell wall biosynthesis